MARNKSSHSIIYNKEESLPQVSVLMAAHNEQKVIGPKMQSLLDQNYPAEKLRIFIGSDNSNDNTNAIVTAIAQENNQVSFTPFEQRQGKPGVINKLIAQAVKFYPIGQNHIFLMTDASVILTMDVIRNLVRHFKDNEMGLVDAHMQYTGLQSEGISKSENTYLGSEVKLKNAESKLFGKMIGPFGGCFALRSDLFEQVPENYLVDDFYLSMKVLEKEKLVINDLEAICHEQVSHSIDEEYRRKKRISTGNFQNLFHFKHLLNPFRKVGFVFLSHKALRWLGPFFLLTIMLCSIALTLKGSTVAIVLLLGQLAWYILVPALDRILRSINVNISLFRSIAYFNKMNFALIHGFIIFLNGVETSIWNPTKRE